MSFGPQGDAVVELTAVRKDGVGFNLTGDAPTEKVTLPFAGAVVKDTERRPDGKLLVLGTAGGNAVLSRFGASGLLDTSFGGAGKVSLDLGTPVDVAHNLVLRPDGKFLVIGAATGADKWEFVVTRHLADGTIDPSFGKDGRLTPSLGRGTRAGGFVSVRDTGEIRVFGWTRADRFVALSYDADGKTARSLLPQEDTIITGPLLPKTAVAATSPVSPKTAEAVLSTDDAHVAVEGEEFTFNVPPGFGRTIYWGDGSSDPVLDGVETATHTYLDGPADYEIIVRSQSSTPINVSGEKTYGPSIASLRAPGLSIGASDRLVLNDGNLIIDYEDPQNSPFQTIWNYAKQRYLSGPNGNGIIWADQNGSTALGVGEASEWSYNELDGVTFDDTTVIGKYTRFGDANLNGRVTSDDYVAIDGNLGTGNSWIEGDFNFSGTVTSDDYVAIDVNLGADPIISPPSFTVSVKNSGGEPTISGFASAAIGQYSLSLQPNLVGPDTVLRWFIDWGDGSDPDEDGFVGEIVPGARALRPIPIRAPGASGSQPRS